MDKQQSIEILKDTVATLGKTFVDDPTVLAAFFAGSIGKGTYDEYSDIDLVVVVAPKNRKAYFRTAPGILRKTVGLKSSVNNDAEDNEWCCLISDNYIGIDLPVLTFFDLIPSHKWADIRIIKDYRQKLMVFKQRCRAVKPKINRRLFVANLEDIKNAQLYWARHIMRGQMVEAMSNCTRASETLFGWLVKLKGVRYHPPTLRDAEKLLTKKELDLLMACRPMTPEVAEVRAAMQSLWQFTMYVIRQYEKTTGHKFPHDYSNASFMRLVSGVYKGERY